MINPIAQAMDQPIDNIKISFHFLSRNTLLNKNPVDEPTIRPPSAPPMGIPLSIAISPQAKLVDQPTTIPVTHPIEQIMVVAKIDW